MNEEPTYILFLNSDSDFSITDQDTNTVTPEKAKQLWESGQVEDYNLAFKRWVDAKWDLDEVKQHYRENG